MRFEVYLKYYTCQECGHSIKISHPNGYETTYMHLQKEGLYVTGQESPKQIYTGDVVGKVGMSGNTTGPHLHYEFRVNGVHRNPLTIKLPDAEPLAKKYRDDYKAKIQPFITDLNLLRRVQLAFYEKPEKQSFLAKHSRKY